jgi:S-(hydroxymethyl)glutathione dehydrogenase/alcohol dehydrogenase
VVDPTGDDHVFDFVGTPPVAERGLAMLAIGGGLYIVGISGPEANVSINMLDAVERQTRVQGIHIGSSSPKHDIPMYADLYLGGQIDLDHLVSKEISLAELNDGYAALKDPAISRVVITSF